MNELKKSPPSTMQKLKGWKLTHLRCLRASLTQLLSTPTSTILTIAVIGIALALPAGLTFVLNNLGQMTGTIDTNNSISLYLKQDLSSDQINQLQKDLRSKKTINKITYISSEEGLEQYGKFSGEISRQIDEEISDQGNLIDLLGDNPLPAVLTLQPKRDVSPEALDSLVSKLKTLPEVDLAQFDSHWAQRLHSIIQLLNKFASVLSVLLVISVLLIIGNTIRVGIQSRLEEIQISRLFGATNAFIRRPFLYSGLLYGVLGGLLASTLLLISYSLIAEPIQQLVVLYQIEFPTSSSSIINYCFLTIMGGGALGIISSWVAVYLYQRGLEHQDFS